VRLQIALAACSNARMSISLAEARTIIETPKRLIDIRDWHVKPNRETRAALYVYEARVRLAQSIPRGIWFRAHVFPAYPDTAKFQLDCEQPGTRAHLPLYRLEWRPVIPHTNGFAGPPELQGLFIPRGRTHEHICFDHAVEHEGRLRAGGVECARPIEPDFQTFSEALGRACAMLSIENCGEIPKPHDQGVFVL